MASVATTVIRHTMPTSSRRRSGSHSRSVAGAGTRRPVGSGAVMVGNLPAGIPSRSGHSGATMGG